MEMGALGPLIAAGGRLHQSGCMGCIGMGQAPATNTISLRTMPRNFRDVPALDDKIYLCSPETAAAAALTGKITDPRDLETLLNISYPQWKEPAKIKIVKDANCQKGGTTELIKDLISNHFLYLKRYPIR
jgi:aconitate hydratase